MSTDVAAEALRTIVSQQIARVSHKHVGLVASVLSGPASSTSQLGASP